MTEQKVRMGVIGAGSIAANLHLPLLHKMGGIEVAAVCDVMEEKANAASEKFGIPRRYTLYREMLEKETLDAVAVMTEPDQLFRPAMVCLQAGKHVFMEKPPGVTTFQAGALLREARAAERILHVGLNRRYVPLLRHVLQRTRELTDITQVVGRMMKQGSGAFWQGCTSAYVCDTIHVLDTVRWIAGAEAEEAATVEAQVDEDIPNAWNSVVRFKNGVTGVILANYRTGARTHSFEIHGPGASAFINLGWGDMACSAQILPAAGEGSQSLASQGLAGKRQILVDGKELAGSDEFGVFYGYRAEWEEFFACVRTGRRPETDIEEAWKTMQFLDFLRSRRIPVCA